MADYDFEYSLSMQDYFRICGEIQRKNYAIWVNLLAISIFFILAATLVFICWMLLALLSTFSYDVRLYISGAVGCISIIMLGKWLTPWLNSKLVRFNKLPVIDQMTGQFSVSKDGIIIREKYLETKIQWAGIKDVFDMPSAVGLFYSPNTIFIQNEHFYDFDEKDKFIEYCRAQIKANI